MPARSSASRMRYRAVIAPFVVGCASTARFTTTRRALRARDASPLHLNRLTTALALAKVTSTRPPTESPHKPGFDSRQIPARGFDSQTVRHLSTEQAEKHPGLSTRWPSFWRIRDAVSHFYNKEDSDSSTRLREETHVECLQAAWFNSKIRLREAANPECSHA